MLLSPHSLIGHIAACMWLATYKQKPVNELGCGKLDVTNLLSLVVAIAERNDAVVERFQAAVGDSDAENVAAKIVERLVASSGVLGMNDPTNLPDGSWNESK